MSATARKIKEDIISELETDNVISFLDRDAKVAELAYLKAENRGFAPGHELDDWLEAEQEYDQQSSKA